MIKNILTFIANKLKPYFTLELKRTNVTLTSIHLCWCSFKTSVHKAVRISSEHVFLSNIFSGIQDWLLWSKDCLVIYEFSGIPVLGH